MPKVRSPPRKRPIATGYSGGRGSRRRSRSPLSNHGRTWQKHATPKLEDSNKTNGVPAIRSSLKKLEARLESSMSAMTSHINLSRGLQGSGNLQRQDFVAAAFRMPDGEPWKEKV